MKITKIWFDKDRIYGLTDDGRTLWQSLLYYRRLRQATDEQRATYEIDDEGIHWEALDEDVSFESFEYDDPEPTGISHLFLSHPELNAAAIGRRIGISQSLMAQYINGMKKPSRERESLILNEIAKIASELQNLCASYQSTSPTAPSHREIDYFQQLNTQGENNSKVAEDSLY